MREANKFDIPALIEMMRGYAKESPIKALHDSDDEAHVNNIFLTLILGRGFVLIEEGKGMLAAIITPNFWNPKVLEIKELAWWVHPDHRNGMVGGRLFVAFNKKAQELIEAGRAHIVTASLMGNINIEKQGFHKIDSTYVKE